MNSTPPSIGREATGAEAGVRSGPNRTRSWAAKAEHGLAPPFSPGSEDSLDAPCSAASGLEEDAASAPAIPRKTSAATPARNATARRVEDVGEPLIRLKCSRPRGSGSRPARSGRHEIFQKGGDGGPRGPYGGSRRVSRELERSGHP